MRRGLRRLARQYSRSASTASTWPSKSCISLSAACSLAPCSIASACHVVRVEHGTARMRCSTDMHGDKFFDGVHKPIKDQGTEDSCTEIRGETMIRTENL